MLFSHGTWQFTSYTSTLYTKCPGQWSANPSRRDREAWPSRADGGSDIESRPLEELIARLSTSNGRTRQRVRETLAAIGEPAVPSLVALLGSPQVRLRWEAAKALTQIPDPAAIPDLVSLLGDPEAGIRWLAAIGLINIGSRSVPPVLQALTECAASKGFRDASHHVLHGVSRRNAVLREILGPVLAVLGDTGPVGVISSRAEVALHELRALSGD